MTTGKEVIKVIISHSIKFVAFLLISYWFLYPNGLIVQFLNVDLSFLILPLVILSTALYASAIINAIFTLKIAKIIGNALKGLAIALAIYLLIPCLGRFLMSRALLDILSSLNYWLLLFMLTVIFNNIARSLADLYHEPLLEISSTSLFLFLTGFLLNNILSILILYLPPPIDKFPPEIFFWSFIVAAVISLFSILRNFPNPYLHFIGVKVGSNIAGITLLSILTLTYFSVLRPYITKYFPYIANVISLIEWGVVCLSFWVFYRNLRNQVNKFLMEPLHIGNWTTLRQEIEHHVDLEQINVSKIVEEFINCGVKDGIITHIVSVMLSNGVSEEKIRGIVRRLIEYQDIPYPKIRLSPWIKRVDEENKMRRKDVLQKMLLEIELEIKTTKQPPEIKYSGEASKYIIEMKGARKGEM
jgi:hypothetical protein